MTDIHVEAHAAATAAVAIPAAAVVARASDQKRADEKLQPKSKGAKKG
jgi:hypothetical protein